MSGPETEQRRLDRERRRIWVQAGFAFAGGAVLAALVLSGARG